LYPESGTLADSIHIESHTALLQRSTVTESSARTLDAILVPTIRPASLQPAVDLVSEVGCLLVVLCTTEEQALQTLSWERADNTFVTYVPPAIGDPQLNFLTSVHPDTETERSCHVDIARKRNIGLLLARICGWRTVMYLDDDIRKMTASAVTSAAKLLGCYQAVGFEISHYPDNSVVCHAHRLAGGKQGVFPGASSLLVDVSRSDSFFPPIYNEDWLFLFDAVKTRSLAVAGELTQLDYLPFAHSGRAASEEFGDLIAEGLYRLIHERASVTDATLDYWRAALKRRVKLIDDIATRLLLMDEDRPVIGLALMSLAAARKRLDAITALACVSFVRAWRTDLDNWRSRLPSLPTHGDVRDAAKSLGLPTSMSTLR
jgi:hypothetical protein